MIQKAEVKRKLRAAVALVIKETYRAARAGNCERARSIQDAAETVFGPSWKSSQRVDMMATRCYREASGAVAGYKRRRRRKARR